MRWGSARCLQIRFNTFAVGLLSTPCPMGHICVFLRETPILISILILILIPSPFHSHPILILISIPLPSSTPSPSHPILIPILIPIWLPARAEHRLPGTPHSDSPVAPGSRAGPGNPVERRELSRTPTAASSPLGGPRDPRPLRDTHLVALLTGAAWEPTLTPRSLQGEGVRWVGGTSLHPQPPQLPPPRIPHSPPGADWGGHLPLAPRDQGDRPSRGVPGKGGNRVRWMWLAGPWGGGHLGDPPAPLPLEQGPEGLTSSPFSPGGPT